MTTLAAVLGLCPLLFAQTHLSVPIDDRLYTVLEIAELRGLLPKLPAARPYPESHVKKYLGWIGEKEHLLSGQEREIYRELIASLQARKSSPARIHLAAEAELRSDIKKLDDIFMYAAGSFGLVGDLVPALSYHFDVGQTFDIPNTEAFAPYAFTKPWDGQPVGKKPFMTRYRAMSFHNNSSPEIAASLLEDRFLLRWSHARREWGVGDGSLVLSGTARPFDGIDISGRLAEGVWFHFVTGSLGYYAERDTEQKMLTAHMGEFTLLPWLYLSAWEAVVWGKRLELAYLNPFNSYAIAQLVSAGDLDNIAIGGSLALTWSPYLRWYFSIFLDEVNTWRPDVWFQNPMNMYAFYTGIKVPVPGLPLTLATLQYTKIEPYCYTHYLQDYPFFYLPQNINFTNDGENLGYHLPPNSDELLVKLQCVPSARWQAAVQYQLIRHGDGDHLAGQIEGDIDVPIDYNTYESYPRKDFLHDGIYEWIHIAQFSAAYSFINFGLTLWGGYAFAHAANYNNIPGNTEVKNLLAAGVRWAY